MPMFLVCDDDCFKAQPLGKQEANDSWTYNSVFNVYKWSDDNQAELDAGWFVKADTIEELAAKMTAVDTITGETLSVDATQLQATIDAYNAACKEGVDAFGRPQEYLAPIVTPPFYAAEMMPCIVYTIGGVKSNGCGQVVGPDDKPIPRLYCAGNVGQGVGITPIGAVGCMTRGRIAAAHAVTLDPLP